MPDYEDPKEFSKKVVEAMARQKAMLSTEDPEDMAHPTLTGPRGYQVHNDPRPAGYHTYERQETPEERTKRYLDKSKALPKNPDMETPDERLERFRQKAQGRNDVSAPADIELDEEPLSWSNAGEKMINYPASLVPQRTAEKEAAYELAIMKVRNAIDQKAVPIAEVAKRHEPAARWLDDILTATDRARNPKKRDIGEFERSDSEDMPIRKYKVVDGKGVGGS